MSKRRDWVSLRVAKAPHERLRAVGRPVSLVVELFGIEDDLVEELAHANGMRSRAGTTGLKGAGLGVGHMSHVIGGIQVLAIPAAVECQYSIFSLERLIT